MIPEITDERTGRYYTKKQQEYTMFKISHFTQPTNINILVSFIDITKFKSIFKSDTNNLNNIVKVLEEYYSLVNNKIEKNNGYVVKFFGDEAFIVFTEQDADKGIQALSELKKELDCFF
jgi:class 3 adenylate cyclase